jgi:DNA-binding CsgD family transcriptional regulator
MKMQVGAWLEAVVAVTTPAGLQEALERRVHELGFRYFVYHGAFPDPGGELHLDTTPAAWRQYCLGRGVQCAWDLLCGRTLRATPILWCRIRSLHPELFDKAGEFGLATGVTQPMHGPGGEWSSLSFISSRAGPQAERRLLGALPYCQLLASLAHDAAGRIVASRTGAAAHDPRDAAPGDSALSERESACLGLAASGKTVVQIAKILPISARTVNYHLVNARRKLQAASLRQAVTKAASLGLIRAA